MNKNIKIADKHRRNWRRLLARKYFCRCFWRLSHRSNWSFSLYQP